MKRRDLLLLLGVRDDGGRRFERDVC